MISKEKIQRINALARKKKESGLTSEEQKEQKALREEYLKGIRTSMKNQLDAVKIVDEEGNVLKESNQQNKD